MKHNIFLVLWVLVQQYIVAAKFNVLSFSTILLIVGKFTALNYSTVVYTICLV